MIGQIELNAFIQPQSQLSLQRQHLILVADPMMIVNLLNGVTHQVKQELLCSQKHQV